jgi:hypothetical protein
LERFTLSIKDSGVLRQTEVSALQASNRVSLAMMQLSVSCTKAINKRFGRVGALFHGKPIQ